MGDSKPPTVIFNVQTAAAQGQASRCNRSVCRCRKLRARIRPSGSEGKGRRRTIREPLRGTINGQGGVSIHRSRARRQTRWKSCKCGTVKRPWLPTAHGRPQLFQRAIAAAPDDESVVVNAAVASLRHDQSELAVSWHNRHFRAGRNRRRLSHAGHGGIPPRALATAQAALRHSLSLDNSHALSYFLLGCTLSKLGQNEEADRNFNQARQLDSRYALKP